MAEQPTLMVPVTMARLTKAAPRLKQPTAGSYCVERERFFGRLVRLSESLSAARETLQGALQSSGHFSEPSESEKCVAIEIQMDALRVAHARHREEHGC